MRTFLALVLVTGCAAQGAAPPGTDPNDALPPEAIGFSEDAVIGGTTTYDRPEVGFISGCTASLVAPDMIITASHCLGYRSATSLGNYGTFTIRPASGASRTFSIVRYRSYATQLGQDDVTLMNLGEPVPAELARPLRLAAAEPQAIDVMDASALKGAIVLTDLINLQTAPRGAQRDALAGRGSRLVLRRGRARGRPSEPAPPWPARRSRTAGTTTRRGWSGVRARRTG